MIAGKFGDIGELFFEIDLITADGEVFPVDAQSSRIQDQSQIEDKPR